MAGVVRQSAGSSELFLDGVLTSTQPAGTEIKNLQFTGDSQGLVYTVTAGARTSLFLDGREITLPTTGLIQDFWAGPHRGQYACLTRNPGPGIQLDLVINGRRLGYAQTVDGKRPLLHSPDIHWFSADGEHLYGFWYNGLTKTLGFFADSVASKPEIAGKPFHVDRLLEPIRIDDSHWEVVGMSNPVAAAKAGTPAFVRFQVEVAGARDPKIN